MKKETAIILFYILYFSWLSIVTFLAPDIKLLTYFTAGITIFYFGFLKEKWDLFFFLLGGLSVILTVCTSFIGGEIKFNFNLVREIPIWLYLAWGTTFVALRKFFIVITK